MVFSLRLAALLGAAFLSLVSASAEVLTWTTGPGMSVQAEYIRATEDAVIVKRVPDGQVLRLPLTDCSDENRAFVAQKQKEDREANTIEAAVRGVINWRLPEWNSLSWKNLQYSELWSWDEKTKQPLEKLATFEVNYNKDPKRNQFTGKFVTSEPVRMLKTGKFVVKGQFSCTVDTTRKSLEQVSTPFPLPNTLKDELDFGTLRFTLTR